MPSYGLVELCDIVCNVLGQGKVHVFDSDKVGV
jgi:hypothetical protein